MSWGRLPAHVAERAVRIFVAPRFHRVRIPCRRRTPDQTNIRLLCNQMMPRLLCNQMMPLITCARFEGDATLAVVSRVPLARVRMPTVPGLRCSQVSAPVRSLVSGLRCSQVGASLRSLVSGLRCYHVGASGRTLGACAAWRPCGRVPKLRCAVAVHHRPGPIRHLCGGDEATALHRVGERDCRSHMMLCLPRRRR